MSEIKRYSLQSGNPHQATGCVVGNPAGYLCYYDDHLSDVEQREKDHAAEVERLKEELEDISETHRMVMDEKCPGDEQHCTCVPILRKELAAKEAEIAAITAALDEATRCRKCGYEVVVDRPCPFCHGTKRDYRHLPAETRALCERKFGGEK